MLDCHVPAQQELSALPLDNVEMMMTMMMMSDDQAQHHSSQLQLYHPVSFDNIETGFSNENM